MQQLLAHPAIGKKGRATKPRLEMVAEWRCRRQAPSDTRMHFPAEQCASRVHWISPNAASYAGGPWFQNDPIGAIASWKMRELSAAESEAQ